MPMYALSIGGTKTVSPEDSPTPNSLTEGNNNILIMRTEGVSVAINATPYTLLAFGDKQAIDPTDNTTTYQFDKECIIAYARYIEVTA